MDLLSAIVPIPLRDELILVNFGLISKITSTIYSILSTFKF